MKGPLYCQCCNFMIIVRLYNQGASTVYNRHFYLIHFFIMAFMGNPRKNGKYWFLVDNK